MVDATTALRQSLTSDFHFYVITVETGGTKWSGTMQQVRIQLFGDRGKTEEVALEDSEKVEVSNKYTPPNATKQLFSSGSILEFRFKAFFVGNMVKIRVSHGDKNMQDLSVSWKLDRIVVKDDDLQRSWAFMCLTWFTQDNNHECEFVHSGDIAAGRRASVRQARRRSIGVSEQSLGRVARMRNRWDSKALEPMTSNAGEGGVRRVCFQLHWNRDTNYDIKNQYMYLFGATPALGEWDPTKAIRMVASTGADGTWRGEWRIEMEMDDDYDLVEYQYLIIDENNDRVWFFDKSFVLKLSNPTDSKDRTVEGGMIYVRDCIDSNKSGPFVELKPGAHKFRTPVKLSGVNASARKRTTIRRASVADRRNSIGFMPRGGNVHLQTEKDAKFLNTPESASPEARSPELQVLKTHADSNSTSKLRDELENTSVLLRNTKSDLVSKNQEIAMLKKNLERYSEDGIESILGGPRNGSPVTSEAYPLSPNLVEDANSETPEATDSEGPEVTPSQSRRRGFSVLENDEPAPDAPLYTPPQYATPAVQIDTEKLRKDALAAQAQCAGLSKELGDLREMMTKQCADWESRQAELVRLNMDLKERRAAEVATLTEERDAYANDLAAVQGDVEFYQTAFTSEKQLRKKLHDEVLDLKGNIRVFCRVRPPKSKVDENGNLMKPALEFPNEHVGDYSEISVDGTAFTFPQCFPSLSRQEDVYGATSGIVEKVLDGYNVCIMAYGQTGSGKTYTMSGPKHDPGVNYRALQDVFRIAGERAESSKTTVTVSMLEIYNEKIRDLLVIRKKGVEPENLDIRKVSSSRGDNRVHVPGLLEQECSTLETVWSTIERGTKNRAVEATLMNQESSRSHLIVRVKVNIENLSTGSQAEGILSLVDLAGSEDINRSGVKGARQTEATKINLSLTHLSMVFDKLEEKMKNRNAHIPYKNSKLTHLLADSIGGDSKTLMFVNISCDKSDWKETTRTLQFGRRVASIELGKAKKQTTDVSLQRKLQEQIKENERLSGTVDGYMKDTRRKDEEIKKMSTKMKSLESALNETKTKLDVALSNDKGKASGFEREITDMKRRERDMQSELNKMKMKNMDDVKKKDEEIKSLQRKIERLQEGLPIDAGSPTAAGTGTAAASPNPVRKSIFRGTAAVRGKSPPFRGRSPPAAAARGRSPPAPTGRGRSPPAPAGRGRSPPAPTGRGRSPPAPAGRGRSPPPAAARGGRVVRPRGTARPVGAGVRRTGAGTGVPRRVPKAATFANGANDPEGNGTNAANETAAGTGIPRAATAMPTAGRGRGRGRARGTRFPVARQTAASRARMAALQARNQNGDGGT